MGKASRVKQASAREKIAAQRAAQRKQEIRNRMFLTIGSIVGVVVIVVAFLFIKALHKGGSSGSAGGVAGTALPASVVKDITSVPASTLSSIGSGGAYAKTVSTVSAPPLTSGGKPEILYMGAEYCPYCATERWAMVDGAEPVRHVLRAARHPLVQHRRVPQHPDADLPRLALHQQVPDVHPGRDPGPDRGQHAADADQRAEQAVRQVRQRALRVVQ